MSKRVAVIGAGVFGAWTAHHLLHAGHQVTLIDAWGPAHSRSSSGGESRLTRGAYGKDAIYTRMARDSLPQWQSLSASAGLPIFVPAGVLFFFPSEEPYFRDSVAVHRDLGLETQVLDRSEMTKRFPMIDFAGISLGLFEPAFGALLARRALLTLVEKFVAAGGTYLTAAVAVPTDAEPRVNEIRLSTGERLGADHFEEEARGAFEHEHQGHDSAGVGAEGEEGDEDGGDEE